MSKDIITEDQHFMINAIITRKSKELIDSEGVNSTITLGMGGFDFNPSYITPLYRPPAIVRDYGMNGHKSTPEFKQLVEIAMSELARLRGEPGFSIEYSSKTWIGPPTLIGEDDDISLMGFLMQKFPRNYVFGGDFIRGFSVEGDCLYQKVIQFHSVQTSDLQDALKEGLSKRLEEFEIKR